MLSSSAATYPHPRLARETNGRLLLYVPALLLAAMALPYAYGVTLAEPDLVRMMAGMVYGGVTGLHEAAGNHYGLSFSFAYYRLLYALAPASWLRDPDAVALLINAAGMASGLLCALAGTAYFARLLGRIGGVVAAIAFFLSPMMLPVAFSGHPIVPAAAALFAGALLLARAEQAAAGVERVTSAAAAFALLLLGLALRAEIVFAFPFLWLAISLEKPLGRPVAAALAWKALLLGGAFAVFLFLQHDYVEASGGAGTRLATFVETYVSPSRVARGAFVLMLAAGVATLVAAAFAASRLRRDRRVQLFLVLALPALAFWLPNPQPARHFFFVVLAASLVLATWLGARSPARALVLALLVAVANQAIAELLYRPIVTHYQWSYPVAGRQPTQQVPLGAFMPAQRANQRQAALEREEAIRLTAQAPQRLLVLADDQHYLIAHLLATYPSLRWSEKTVNGILYTRLESPRRAIVLVEKYSAWPRDVTREVLADPSWQAWPVYVQPFTVSRYDKTDVPRERRFALR